MSAMRKFLDGVVIVLGLWLIVSAPLLLSAEHGLAMGCLIVLGLVIIGFSFWGETAPKNSAPEVLNIFVGLLVFVSPWLLSFTDVVNAAWNAWIIGIAMVVLEAFAVPRAMMERTPHQPG